MQAASARWEVRSGQLHSLATPGSHQSPTAMSRYYVWKSHLKQTSDCWKFITPASLLRVGDKWQPSVWMPEIYSNLQTVVQGEDRHLLKRIIVWMSMTKTRDAGSWPSEGHHCPLPPPFSTVILFHVSWDGHPAFRLYRETTEQQPVAALPACAWVHPY